MGLPQGAAGAFNDLGTMEGTRNEGVLGVAFSAHLQSGAERAYFQTDFFFEVVASGMAW